LISELPYGFLVYRVDQSINMDIIVGIKK